MWRPGISITLHPTGVVADARVSTEPIARVQKSAGKGRLPRRTTLTINGRVQCELDDLLAAATIRRAAGVAQLVRATDS